jgi:hypothetical protein
MVTTYRVIVTTTAPFCEPVEFPYGPAQTDRLKAVSSLVSAFELHSQPDPGGWTPLVSVRIDVADALEPEACCFNRLNGDANHGPECPTRKVGHS